MKLLSRTGASVELRPVRYQFHSVRSDTDGDRWDANWLVVRGDVQAPDGRGWSFTDPCLTTWEARGLAHWLHRVATGQVTRSPAPDEDADDVLSFTEPNLAFSLHERDLHTAHLRLHLSAEAAPPWTAQDARWHWSAFYLPLHLGIDEIRDAAEQWERDLAPFPTR
ncbi:hypothetical protein [Frankia sp. Cas4]|uniref:WapI family immunity protein n=1 Tax=Frankia sp. Cas4 TaxID=3073927 RepID=UPI002AD40242|nr:hypothetical protein [Frankia sp. Cas4]